MLRYPVLVPGLVLALVALAGPVAAQVSGDCLECHDDPEFTTTFPESIHGGLECVDCHSTVTELPHDDELPAVACGECHDDAQAAYDESVHAISRATDGDLAPDCKGCHGTHAIEPPSVASAPTNPRNILRLCGKCHSDPEVVAVFGRKGFDPVRDYEASVHGKALAADPERRVATCVACHGSHAILPQYDLHSSFSKFQLPDTCGQCHAQESAAYKESIHWQALKKGHYESPVCNDCHSEHRIMSPSDKTALTNPSLVSSGICANCHSNKTLMDRFGLDANRFATYSKTYHGLAVIRGSANAANCVSCHEQHAIRSSSDPAAATHPANLIKTCGKCHQDVDASFVQVAVHPADQKSRNPAAWFMKVAYVWLIALTVGGMLIHNLIIHSYYVRKKWRQMKSELQVPRFRRFEIVQHALLFLSFFTLVVTGFALKFPDAAWVQVLSFLGLGEAARSLIHRGAALVLVAISLVQLYYLVFRPGGRRDLRSLVPALADLRHLRQNLAFHLGKSREHPAFGRFDYTEKLEYLALIWGTVVMAFTGFVLWFPETFLGVLPAWTFEVCEVVHFYEAWLATLAILIWHWYFVLLHPESYPMSFAWFTGKLPESVHRKHHPEEALEEA